MLEPGKCDDWYKVWGMCKGPKDMKEAERVQVWMLEAGFQEPLAWDLT